MEDGPEKSMLSEQLVIEEEEIANAKTEIASLKAEKKTITEA